ncbi:hypothetical protein PHYSODRAFT_563260 [Phytophthora sojae]|uniref:WRKY transcription factor 19 n=1 Tax=Phytophthora sojae (strain P6497) TaxID=1094619 RepID=G4ZX35_PHYSP|nr:hypothetical protein PHYSODRAFT_563260 [Phytophthora sojae]EGZ12505.1 hypothetical protein PHYSODRAFT_563260 [Phytophthora sojae]|eukprot:XP_009532838.1 hypothetical protein PHYSODRAFT_563260 [Phytophthora sojae]
MDEVAFVESLFAPEMRSAVAAPSSLFPSPSAAPASLQSCGRVKALLVERCGNGNVPTPPGSSSGMAVPAPPNSLLGGGIALSQQLTLQPPVADDAPLFVRLNEDDMFTQMLSDQDFPDFPHSGSGKKTPAAKPPSSSNSLLLEPLDLPRTSAAPEPTTLKDAFYSVAEAPPVHYQQFRPAHRGGICSAANINVNVNFGLDASMMPVFPVANGVYFGGGFAGYPPLSPATHGWIQDQGQEASTPGGNNFQRVHTMKHMAAMAGLGVAMSSTSPMMAQHQPSPGAVDMFSPQHPVSPGMWLSSLRNAQPETQEDRKPVGLDAIKTSVERPPFSLTISPPASLTNKALKELIVSADFATPPLMSRPKRPRAMKAEPGLGEPRAKAARTTSASPVSQENRSGNVAPKVRTTKGKKCIEAGCTRRAQSNSRCKAHGGGARCQYSGPGGCNRSSQGGGFCRAHGGGKRCEFPGCTRGQQRKGRCYVHGGIRKCQYGACEKKDRGNGFCISHGGGKRCEYPDCSRAVRRGLLCQIHEAQEKEAGDGVAL